MQDKAKKTSTLCPGKVCVDVNSKCANAQPGPCHSTSQLETLDTASGY